MIDLSNFPHHPFWSFSLEVYSQPGVAPACLVLQDKYDLDVNLLLFCCWAGACDRKLSPGELEELLAMVAEWREAVVCPLRAVRRAMKTIESERFPQVAELRKEVKGTELWAEALQQQAMYDFLPLTRSSEGDAYIAAENIVLYLRACSVETFDTADCADLAAIVRGGFPEIPPLEAVWLFQS